MAEPNVQVPESWLRDAVVSIKCEQYDGPLVRRLEALLSQQNPTADPYLCRGVVSPDLVPCPECGGLGYDVDWADPPSQGPCGRCEGGGYIDPSTVCDVTPPPATPEEVTDGA